MKPEHQKFVKEYVLNGFNGTKAYQSAYPTAQLNSASVGASNLLKDINIKQAIDMELNKRGYLSTHNREDILSDVHRLAIKSEAVIDYGNAIKAQDLRAKLAGLYTGDQETGQFDKLIQMFQINVKVEPPAEPSNPTIETTFIDDPGDMG